MGLAHSMSHSGENGLVTPEGKRAAANFVGQKLRRALEQQNAFKPHELTAIVESYVTVLRTFGTVKEADLAEALHSRAIPKDLADALAHALSNRR